jgi:hypothetical protein
VCPLRNKRTGLFEDCGLSIGLILEQYPFYYSKKHSHIDIDLASTCRIMAQLPLATEAIVSIIFGILQLAIGLASLWQQRYFRPSNRTLRCALGFFYL